LGALAPLASVLPWTIARLTDKVPLDRTGRPSNPHVPAQHRSYDEAAAEVARMGSGHGLGGVLTHAAGVTVIDIDNALQPDSTWSPLALELCAALVPHGAVVEVSQSGRGLHIWCRYRNPPEHSCKRTDLKIECYSADRYILLGRPGAVGTLAEQCDALPAVLARYFPPSVEAADDLPDDGPCADWRGPPEGTSEGNAELLRMALASRSAGAVFGSGASFADLWTGNADALARAFPPSNGHRADGLPYDASSADAALFAHLAWWTGRDAARMARIAQGSALRRDKWEQRPDYLPRTIGRACKLSGDVLGQRQPAPPADTSAQAPGVPLATVAPVLQGDVAAPLLPVPPAHVPPFKLVSVADLWTRPAAPQAWVWGHYIPAAHVTLLAGHGGSRKSSLMLRLAACVALGVPFLAQQTTQGRVCVFSAEDPGELVRLRLARICRDLSADPAALAQGLDVLDATDASPALFSETRAGGVRAGVLTATYDALRQHVEATRPALLIVDNASDAFDADEINRAAVRAFIRSLALLVREWGGAVLLLAHVDKATAKAPKGMGNSEGYSGSSAWHNSARSRLYLAEVGPGLYELQHQKSNLGPRAEPLTLLWPADGPPMVLEGARVPGAEDAELRALLALVAEFSGRGEHVSTSPTGRPNVTQLFGAEVSYPRGMKVTDALAILRDAERRELLAREQYRTPDRKLRERFAITDAGRSFLAGAPSAPTSRRVELSAVSTPWGGAPAPTTGGVGELAHSAHPTVPAPEDPSNVPGVDVKSAQKWAA
jgi:hypothetical protein